MNALQGALWRHYDIAYTRRPQRSVIDCTLESSGHRATDKMKGGWKGDPCGVLVAAAETQQRESLDINA